MSSPDGGILSYWNLSNADCLAEIYGVDGQVSYEPLVERTDELVFAAWLVEGDEDSRTEVHELLMGRSAHPRSGGHRQL